MNYVCPNGHDSTAEDFCDTCGAKIDANAQAATPATPATSASNQAATGMPGSAGPSGGLVCPNCATENLPESLFCEACGYDFTTGAMPRGTDTAPESAVEPAEGAQPDVAEDVESAAGSAPEAESAAVAGGIPAVSAAVAAVGAPTRPAAAAEPGTGVPPGIPMEWVAEVWIDPDWYAGQEAEEPMPSPGLPVVVPLTVRSALIGRVSTSKHINPDIDCTSDSGVSRRHAQLTTDGTRWFVEDLGSSNGTFVGDAGDPLPEEPIEVGPKRELGDDDRIYLGAWTRIVVREATDEEKAAAAAG